MTEKDFLEFKGPAKFRLEARRDGVSLHVDSSGESALISAFVAVCLRHEVIAGVLIKVVSYLGHKASHDCEGCRQWRKDYPGLTDIILEALNDE